MKNLTMCDRYGHVSLVCTRIDDLPVISPHPAFDHVREGRLSRWLFRRLEKWGIVKQRGVEYTRHVTRVTLDLKATASALRKYVVDYIDTHGGRFPQVLLCGPEQFATLSGDAEALPDFFFHPEGSFWRGLRVVCVPHMRGVLPLEKRHLE